METVIRVVIIYIAILAGLRMIGKREFGQLSAAELVTLLIIPEVVSQTVTREDSSLTNALIAIATLLSLVFITSSIVHADGKIEKVMMGKPVVLVVRGKMLEDNMNKERVSPDEILTAMHMNGLERIEEVKWAILENDGKISIVSEDWVRVSQSNPEARDTTMA
jgi:uncharacterized membrane protein YcaP (DUF421 family)